MSLVPPQFSKFGGHCCLFNVYERDPLEHSLTLKSRTADGLSVETGIVAGSKGTSAQRGFFRAAFAANGYNFDGTFNTDASKSTSLTVKRNNAGGKSIPGLDVSATAGTVEKDLPNKPKFGLFDTFTAQYSRDHFTAGLGVTSDLDTQHSVSTNASVGYNGLSVGGETKCIKVGPGAWEHLSYNAGLGYTQGKYSFLLRSDSKFEKLKAYVVAADLGAGGRTKVGVQAKVDLTQPKVGAPQREITAAVCHKLSADTSIHARLVFPSQQAVLSVSHTLANPRVQVKASAIANLPNAAFAPATVAKFGVSLTFGEF